MANDKQFKVNEQAPLGLNLRSAPDPMLNNIVAVLPFGQIVTKLEESQTENWWYVQTDLDHVAVTGFVNQKYLSPIESVEPALELQGIVAVHLPTAGKIVTRQNERRAYPLTEEPPVKRHQADQPADGVKAIGKLIEWFDVETSGRYKPLGVTYCNIYAYDYCYMTQAYLPRVWWTDKSLLRLKAGESVPVVYGGIASTVKEMVANDLDDWFRDWGGHFNWRRSLDVTEMQSAANQGKVCIIVGKAKPQHHHGHGHIVAVVPETDLFRAKRQDNKVIMPVQSQAGAHNHAYVVQSWWADGTYSDFGFWIHD